MAYDHARTTRRGAPRTYSEYGDIVHSVTVGGMPVTLRATEGLLVSVLSLLKVELPVPHYTTLCRRGRKLAVNLPQQARDEPLRVVVDATGIMV